MRREEQTCIAVREPPKGHSSGGNDPVELGLAIV